MSNPRAARTRVPVPSAAGRVGTRGLLTRLTQFAKIASGTEASHTCALTTAGAAWCWGYNGSGQLGDGTTTQASLPVPVAGDLVFTALAVGSSHTCALDSDGAAWCWGNNGYGQLGDGSTTSWSTPGVITGGKAFTTLVAGSQHTCGLTSSGAAWCWGYNQYGQLGDGTGNQAIAPVAVTGGKAFTTLVAGGQHTCGLTAAGAAWCWGYNRNGQLGDGTIDQGWPPQGKPAPVAVTGGKAFTSLVAGSSHTCGLTAAGAAWCWGENQYGRLGDGTSNQAIAPVAVTGGTAFTTLVAGGQHTCGLTAAGAAWCWGYNGNGQLGDGTIDQGWPPQGKPAPVAVTGGKAFTTLMAGWGHTCGLTATGAAWCWGYNQYGQLGGNPAAQVSTPVAVGVTDAPSTATPVVVLPTAFSSLVAGSSHTCGLTAAGIAWCWGYGPNGQLGDGTTNGGVMTTPVAVTGGKAFTALAAGTSHTCGLTEDGTAWCWGSNGLGQLGDGTTNQATAPVAVTGGKAFTSLAAGSQHTCGLTAAGIVWCWGSNGYGQLGGVPATPVSPVAVTGGKAFTSLTAGSQHTCGLTAAGTAWCWGGNQWGQLGTGSANSVANRPAAVSGGKSFTSLASGADAQHTCGVATDGTVWCWGVNNYGQLGDGTTTSAPSPIAVYGGKKFRSVTVGSNHTCGIAVTGTTWCWGANDVGQLGDGSMSGRLRPSLVRGHLDLVALSAGQSHTCGRSASGATWCWGTNWQGQLGIGSNGDTHAKPTLVSGILAPPAATATPIPPAPSVYTSLFAGDNHTCGITATGAAWCWGSNGYGQLGDGTTTDRAAPALVADVGEGFATLAAGDAHTCGITTGGATWCWGRNDSGQLGIGYSGASEVEPIRIAGNDTFVNISAGGRATCAKRDDLLPRCWGWVGTWGSPGYAWFSAVSPIDLPASNIWTGSYSTPVRFSLGANHLCSIASTEIATCGGSNDFGQLAYSMDSAPGQSHFINYLESIHLTGLTSGANHTCGLTQAGAPWCWGKGSEGQLGNGTYVASSAQPVAVTPGRVFTSLDADAASNHTCGLGTSGDAWCWGYNYFGQLGTGDTANRANPVAVGGGLTFASLAVGGNHTCGLTPAGVAWCWGLNVNGQLGDGSHTNRTTPGLVATSGNVVVPVTATPTVAPVPSIVPTVVPGTGAATRSLRVANITDTSITVSWATGTATTGTVRWGLDDGTALTNVANDRRGAGITSPIHYVTLSGLAPATRYRFDVANDTTTDTNGGTHYVATTGPTLAITTPSLAYGTVSLRDGGVPSGVIVQVVATGSNGTSAPLTDLIVPSDQRTWAINLGNLRTASLEAAFPFDSSTVLTVTADGGADGTAVGTVTVANALTGSLSLTLSDEVTMPLQSGWNLVALRANPTSPTVASGVCTAINTAAAGAAVELDRWVDSAWESHLCGLPPHPFAVETGAGYFVRMSAPATWTYRGSLVATPSERSLSVGWNLVGVSAVSGSPSTAATACSQLNASQAGTAVEMDRWIDGGWEGHRCDLPPNDFTLEAGKGYFVRLTRVATWAPTGTAPVSAAAVQR